MKRRSLDISRSVVVFLAALAWFSISNHCVLADLVAAKTRSASATIHCHSKQPVPEKQKGDENMPCCKVLKALVAKTLSLTNSFDFVLREYFPGAVLPLVSEPHRFLIACDSGPPAGVVSFSESVLQRSLLSHAPPFLV